MRARRGSEGFTLIELLSVVAIIGVITAVAIPFLQMALDKAKQRSTMAGMRSLATGIQLYNLEENLFPAGATPAATLTAMLQPLTKIALPHHDGWHHDYEYHSDNVTWYSLESFGKDGVNGVDITPSTALQFHLDLVYATGAFANAPE